MSQDTKLKSPAEEGISATEWVKRGIMLVRRDALPNSDPESWPSLWVKKFGSLDGYPCEDKSELNGTILRNGDIYYVCKTCNCVNVVANNEMFGY